MAAHSQTHPSWQQSESECLLVISEDDQEFVGRKLGFISRCSPGRQPSLEDGARCRVKSRNIKAWSWLGDSTYITEVQQEPMRHTQRSVALRLKFIWAFTSKKNNPKH